MGHAMHITYPAGLQLCLQPGLPEVLLEDGPDHVVLVLLFLLVLILLRVGYVHEMEVALRTLTRSRPSANVLSFVSTVPDADLAHLIKALLAEVASCSEI